MNLNNQFGSDTKFHNLTFVGLSGIAIVGVVP
jgi:hypothetical protein